MIKLELIIIAQRLKQLLPQPWQLALALLIGVSLLLCRGNLCKVLNFNLASIALSHWVFEPRLADARAYLSKAMYWGEKSDIRWSQRGYATRTQVLWQRVNDQQIVTQERAEAAYRQGQELERQQCYEAALDSYQQAVVDSARCIHCLYALYSLAMQQGQVDLAWQQQEMLLSLQPRYVVSMTLDNGARLLGYDLDEVDLERALGPISIVFYWELPEATREILQWQTDAWHYIQVHQRVFQIGCVDNLFTNGGLERDLSDLVSMPYGYRSIFYAVRKQPDYQQAHYALKVDTRYGNLSQVAVVVGKPEGGLEGLTSASKIDVDSDSLYILGGWLRSIAGGRGYLGGVWRDQNKEDMLYWYTAQGFESTSWQSFVAISGVPPGAMVFTPLLLNKGRGEVYFDDLVFLRLPVLEHNAEVESP